MRTDARRHDPPLPGERQLTVDEVRLLWSFVHGDIMDGGMRERLRGSWGLCDRHSWGHAIVEVELWQDGAGPSGGHQPFDVCVLYDDLLQTMLHRIGRGGGRRMLGRTLRGDGTCPVCRDLTAPTVPGQGSGLGYAGSDAQVLALEANTLRYTRALLRDAAAVWNGMVCPRCGDGQRADGRIAEGPLCRRHLGDELDDLDAAVRRARAELAVRRVPLRQHLESMTQRGVPADATARAAWIGVLGWFHGWEVPVALAAAGPTAV